MNERPPNRASNLASSPPTALSENERRVATRVGLDVDVTIYAATGAAGREYIGVASDLSRDGIFISTFARVSVGARVTLKFRLPEGLVICDAEVRRIRTAGEGVTGGLGLSFLTLSDLDRSLIDRYCPELVRHNSHVQARQSVKPEK